MFQFYGANRTCRWAGRLIQLQNLPQNHMDDLDAARELVRIGDYDSLSILYDDIPRYPLSTYPHCFICGHVHDELIIECSEKVSLEVLCQQMAKTPD